MAKKKVVRYRDPRGKFITKATYQRWYAKKRRKPKAKPKFTPEEEGLLQGIRKQLRGKKPALLPAGTEFELTAVTLGGTPKRK